MAKRKKTKPFLGEPMEASAGERRKWEVEDALRTLTRAQEIQDNKSLMREVRTMASTKAKEMNAIAGRLAKRGMISSKQMAKLDKRAA